MENNFLFSATRTHLQEILPFRSLFLRENNFQIRYHACHERNWSDSYLLKVGDTSVGYGSLKGKDNLGDRDAIFAWFVLPPFRKYNNAIFRALLAASGASFIECQSNDFELSSMLYEHAVEIVADVVLFREHIVDPGLEIPGVIFRRRMDDDVIFEHILEPVGEYVLEADGEVVATGGFMTHYNPPFADLYMEVRQDRRRKGLASYLLQEVKKECYLTGRVPAARCNIDNAGSRGALTNAGLKICGYMLTGTIRNIN